MGLQVHSQSGLRRLTNTTEEGLNLNPSLSGDGLHVAFESTEDIAHAGGSNFFRAISADLSTEPPSFIQMGGTRAPAPAISQDGSFIAFASKDNPLGTNGDGNSEIYLFDGTSLRQLTNTSPGSNIADRVRNGNFPPSISDDGRFIAFASNRDLVGLNPDSNLEIFVYDSLTRGCTQITNSQGTVGATDAKISGNGTRIAFIRDNGATLSAQRDLILFDRPSGTIQVAAANVPGIAFTYGRAISDDGTRVAFAADSAVPNSTQVYLFDRRSLNLMRPVTFLGARVADVPLHPTISGDGSRIAFATRRNVIPGNNSDGSVELYTFDIPTGQFAQVTDVKPKDDKAPAITAEVISSLNDGGTVIAFNFPRLLSGPVAFDELGNNSEIYVTATTARAPFGSLTVLNGASFGHEPASTKAVAPDSIAVALGGDLANTTEQSQRQADGTFPRNVGGTTVTVNNRPAQIFFVSPAQVNFLVPPETETGTAEVIVTNATGFQTKGTVAVLRAAPGVFTFTGDGTGEGVILDATTLQSGPFDPTNGQRRLIVFATGVRNAAQTTATIGGRVVTVEAVMASPNMPGLDEIHLLLPADLRGAGTVELFIRADGRDSNPVNITLTGEARRDVLINEVLADPPDGPTGDANHDGTRDGSQDEFIEIVNATASDIDISNFELLTRGTGGSQDTLRHRFAQGRILPAGGAIVVFGGGSFDPTNPAFGGAQVVKASTGGLALVNGGGVVTLRDTTGAVLSLFSYGGSTNLNADANQSLTRSPDITGGFVAHTSAAGSEGRIYSPGTRVDGSPFVSPAIARIEITPATASIFAGQSQQFTAHAFDSSGHELSGVIFTWQTSNTAVATVDQSGLATGVSEGTAEVRASARGVQSAPATLAVNAAPPVLTSITISPLSATVDVGQTQQFTAQALDQFNQPIGGLTITFASNNTTVATVDLVSPTSSTGAAAATVTAHANGTAQLRATAANGSKTVTSTPATLTVAHIVNAGDVLISEFRFHGPTGANDEFIELYNRTTSPIDISGYKIFRSNNAGSTTSTATIPAGKILGPGCHYLLAHTGYTGPVPADQTYSTGVTDDGGIALTTASGTATTGIIDQVGLSAGSAYKEGTPLSPLTTNVNQSYERKPGGASGNGTDTNNNAADFFLNPGSSNPQNLSSGCLDLSTADLAITKTDSPDPVITGSDVTYTIVVTNNGPGPAQAVVVTDDLTGTANVISCASTSNGQCGGTGNSRTITFASLSSGESATITLIAKANGAGGTTISNTATVSSATADANAGNNSSTATTGVQSATPLPTLSVNNLTQSEGNSGTTPVDFTVALSASSTQTVTVGYSTSSASPATATATTDYQPTSGTLTFNPGETSKTITVTINGDTLVEPDETFFVNLSSATNANISDGQGQATITNDDAANLVISQVYGGGNNAGAVFQRDFIEIFNRGTTTVDFSLTPYSVQYASAGANFGSSKTDLTSGTIVPGRYFLIQESGGTTNGAALTTPDAVGTIALGNTSGKVALVVGTTALPAAICPGDDGIAPFNPNNSTITDFLGYGSVSCYEGPTGPAPAPDNTTSDFRKAGGCTDTNNNAADFFVHTPIPRNTSSPANSCSAGFTPNLSINDVTVTEGNSGTVTATFNVTLSAPANGADVAFDIATQNNTATTANNDYALKSLTNQVIPAGQQTYTFNVTINGDTAIEADETFFVNVTNVSGANVTDGQGTGTIHHDDLPALSINDVTQSEGNSGATTFNFTVHLSAPAPTAVTFDIATADGTAQDGNPAGEDNDYAAKSLTTQIIPAGQQDYNFAVTLNGDLNIEPNEIFLVNVTNVSGASVADGQGQGTIQNDDSPVLSINDVTLSEGDSATKTFTFTVSLTLPAPGTGVTFDITTADGTAHDDVPPSEDNDYVARSLMHQIIPAGQQTYIFDVTVNGDTIVEPNETFFVNVTNVSGAAVSDSQGQGTIQNDDAANLVISQIYGGGGNSGATYTNDFVEIFNHGTTTVDFSVTPYSVQYIGATGSFGSNAASNKTNISSGTVAPGQYFLVQEAATNTASCGNAPCGIAPPTADATGSISLATSGGKVALVSNTTAVSAASCPGDDLSTTPTNPSGNNIVDFVGYGGASCYEGPTGPAAAHSNTTSDFRKSGGCIDMNNNAADFTTATPGPRNTSSPLNMCAAPVISISDATVSESTGATTTATFNVSLNTTSTQTITVNYATADSTATAPADYLSASSTLTFNPGELTKTISITVNGDDSDEPDETFFVNLSGATNTTIADSQGQGTITDDDNAPTISINDVTVAAEGDTGTVNATFTVTLSALSGKTVTVDYATANSTATSPADYQAASTTTLTFNPGELTKTISVVVNGDTLDEANETFFVNLTNAVNATITDSQGQATITDDDAAPSLSIDDVTVTEGNSGTSLATFTVTLSSASGQNVTLNFATANGTATASADYGPIASNPLTFFPGTTTRNIQVTIIGDTLNEVDETFFVNLSNATNATISDSQGQGTITDDDPLPSLSINDVTVTEGNSGTLNTNFTVTLSAASGRNVTVDYATADGTATAGSDYQATSNSLTFAPGELMKTISVPVIGDPDLEPNETFVVNLTNASNATISDAQGQGTILDNDGLPTLSINDVTVNEGAGSAVFTVTLSDASTQEVKVDFATGNGTAEAGTDYTAQAGTLTFAVGGSLTQTITVPIIDDPRDEDSQTFSVNLSNPVNATIADGQGVGTITDNDNPPTLHIDHPSVTEGNTGTTVTADFHLFLTVASEKTVTVDYVVSSGTAVIGSDLQGQAGGTLTFTPGQLTKTVSVIVNGDDIDEDDEVYFVNIFNAVNATINTSSGQGTILDDDPTPSLAITATASATEGNTGTPNSVTFTVTLSTASGRTVAVNYATASGTATQGTDYTNTSGLLTFNPGVTTQTISVPVIGDTSFEPNETFTVTLSSPFNATIASGQGTGTIHNDDPAVVINEVLADPPGSVASDTQGDANLDGTRNATQDEFVELVNNSNTASVDISGWTIRTRSGTGPETIRHTFAASTTLAAGKAVVVFGGGSPAAASNFGNSLVVTSTTGNLNLVNTGITVVVRDSAGNLVEEFTYMGAGAFNGNNDQSLTRSPDITGSFVQHLSATGAGTRRFSPGTKVDGTSF